MKNLDHILLENQDGFTSLRMSDEEWQEWIEVQRHVARDIIEVGLEQTKREVEANYRGWKEYKKSLQ